MSDGAGDGGLLWAWCCYVFVHMVLECDSGSVDEHFQSFLVQQSVSSLCRMQVNTGKPVCYWPGDAVSFTKAGGEVGESAGRWMKGGISYKAGGHTDDWGEKKSIKSNLPKFCKSFSIVWTVQRGRNRGYDTCWKSHYGSVRARNSLSV